MSNAPSKTVAQAAADYRARKAARFGKLEHGHKAILAELADNDRPLAVKLRAISQEALA